MSTNKTSNYNLHSWVPQDEFHVTEINENFTALDAALHQEVGVLDALLQAETAARTQQAAALTAGLGRKVEMVVGSYVGVGAATLEIELGRKPAAVHIELPNGTRNSSFPYGGLFWEDTGAVSAGVTTTDTGFTLAYNGKLNGQGTKYLYVAFFLQ